MRLNMLSQPGKITGENIIDFLVETIEYIFYILKEIAYKLCQASNK